MPDYTSETYRSIDLSLRIGETLLSCGAGAADVTATMLQVTTACGLRGCVVNITFNTITVSYQDEAEASPQTHMRIVQYRGLDYGYLSDTDTIVRALTEGHIDRPEASQQMNQVRSRKRPYPRWLLTVATGIIAVGVCILFGGQWIAILVAFVTGILIDLVSGHLRRRRIPQFYGQIAGALIAVAAAVTVHSLDIPARTSLVVVSGIIVLLAGVSFVGAIQDALTGFYVTGAARTFEAVLLTSGVIAGVSIGLSIAPRVGADLAVQPNNLGVSDLPLQLFGSVVTTIAFAVSCQVRPRALLGCGLVGLLAQGLFQTGTLSQLGITASSALAAFGVGLVAFSVARRIRVPALVVVTTAIISLLPGLTIYRGLFDLTSDNVFGIITLLTAASVAIALASGVILGEYIAQPLAREAHRLETRLSGPRLVGPLKPVPRNIQRRARRRLRDETTTTLQIVPEDDISPQ